MKKTIFLFFVFIGVAVCVNPIIVGNSLYEYESQRNMKMWFTYEQYSKLLQDYKSKILSRDKEASEQKSKNTNKESLEVSTEEYKGEYEFYELTAFTSGYESTGKTPDHPLYGITASGKEVKENHTLACPKELKFGTRIYIPYFDNVFECEDRGSAIVEKSLDVYMEDLDAALEFGRRNLEVLILDSQ